MVKCSPSPSGILAEAINTKILTKNHPDSPHSHPDSSHSHPDSLHLHPNPLIPTLIPHISRISTMISCIPTLILRVPTLIPCVPIISLIPFPDSPFLLLQIGDTVKCTPSLLQKRYTIDRLPLTLSWRMTLLYRN